MNGWMETLLTICGALIATELLRRFCPEDKMVRFAGSLVALLLLLSGVVSLVSQDWDFSLSTMDSQRQQEELLSYLDDAYQQAAQADAQQSVEELFAAAGLEAEKIEIFTDRNQDGGIVLTGVAASFTYPSQGERAKALLQNVLGEDVQVEIHSGS